MEEATAFYTRKRRILLFVVRASLQATKKIAASQYYSVKEKNLLLSAQYVEI